MLFLNRTEALEFVDARRGLFDAAAATNPFACSEWVRLFLEQVAADDWTVVIPAQDGDSAGLMLLYADGSNPARLSALNNYYGSLYSPLISLAPDRAAMARALLRQFDGVRPRPVALQLAPLDAASPDTLALAGALSDAGWYVRRYFCFGNWYQPCEGLSFADYMGERDSKLHNTWTRKAKKFRAGADGARLQMVTDPAGVDAAMAAYERIYARSWKVPEPYPEFLRGWARTCARRGWLRLGLAWVGDVPIAAQFWFTMNRRAYIFKLAYDESYAKWSAGTVLAAMMFEHSLDQDHVVEVDYLTGDDPYKKSWVSSRRERIGLLACNLRTGRGLMLGAREWAGAMRQRWQRAQT